MPFGSGAIETMVIINQHCQTICHEYDIWTSGPLSPLVLPKFSFGGAPVAVTHQQTYVRVSFTLNIREYI